MHGGHWLPQELQARRENLRKGRTSLSQQLDRLRDAYLHSIIPLAEYERRRRELEQRDHALAEQEGQLCAQAERHEEIAGLAISIQDFCARVRSGLANADFAQKRQLIELLVDRVIVKDSEVEIRYVIPTSPGSEHVRFCHLRTDYLDDPAFGLHDEPSCGGWVRRLLRIVQSARGSVARSAHHLNTNAMGLLNSLRALPTIGCIGVEPLNRRRLEASLSYYFCSTIAVLHARCCYGHCQ